MRVMRDTVASAPRAAGAVRRRARRGTGYFVPVELEPLSLGVVVDGGMVVDGGGVVADGGMVVVGGDADGARSAGRSPRRSFRDSEQAVTRPVLSARAQRPVSSFFIFFVPPCCGYGYANPGRKGATRVPAALTGLGTTITNAGDPHGKGDMS
jgi:hypothetical protein